jgi:hypothetical protein
MTANRLSLPHSICQVLLKRVPTSLIALIILAPQATLTMHRPAFSQNADVRQIKIKLSATNHVELSVKEVSFGDGTGYEYGRPYPRYPTSGMNQPSKSAELAGD